MIGSHTPVRIDITAMNPTNSEHLIKNITIKPSYNVSTSRVIPYKNGSIEIEVVILTNNSIHAHLPVNVVMLQNGRVVGHEKFHIWNGKGPLYSSLFTPGRNYSAGQYDIGVIHPADFDRLLTSPPIFDMHLLKVVLNPIEVRPTFQNINFDGHQRSANLSVQLYGVNRTVLNNLTIKVGCITLFFPNIGYDSIL